MRNLLQEEVDQALDDNGESENGCVAIEATIGELVSMSVGTSCGHVGNTAFVALGVLFPDNMIRLVRGWFDSKDYTMCGMMRRC
jgi:hypothetical protein